MRDSKIFVSYRRADASAQAGRICDALSGALGPSSVFIDVDSIGPGANFADAIYQAIARVDLVVVVIGHAWLAGESARRLYSVDDYVRIEVELALRLGKTVVPVLVGGALMPQADQLPSTIARLADCNPLRVSDSSFHRDLAPLLDLLADKSRQAIQPSAHLSVQATACLIDSHWSNAINAKRYWIIQLDLPYGSHRLEWQERWIGSPLLLDGKQVWKGHFRSLNKVLVKIADGQNIRIVTFAGSALMKVWDQGRQPWNEHFLMTILLDNEPVLTFNWQYPDAAI